jgi:DNA-directed RNA polymerase I subunit RPA1
VYRQLQISNLLMELLKGYQPLNLDSSSKIPAASWKDHSEEGSVIVRGNELLTGILDKSQFGASAYGLVHVRFTHLLRRGTLVFV